jgi:putative hemolysin
MATRGDAAMVSRLRSLAAGTALAVLLVGTVASTAFAAAGPAQPGRYTFSDDHCFADPSRTYCFEQAGALHFVVTPDGREMATITARERTLVYENGVLVGESRTVSVDKALFEAGGLGTFTSVSHTNARFGDVKCVLTTVLRVKDYEVVVDHWNAPDCS